MGLIPTRFLIVIRIVTVLSVCDGLLESGVVSSQMIRLKTEETCSAVTASLRPW